MGRMTRCCGTCHRHWTTRLTVHVDIRAPGSVATNDYRPIRTIDRAREEAQQAPQYQRPAVKRDRTVGKGMPKASEYKFNLYNFRLEGQAGTGRVVESRQVRTLKSALLSYYAGHACL
jgi:hypothetical protein